MKRKTSLMIGGILILIAVLFLGYAARHPETAFLRSLRATYMIYGAYIWLLFKFLVAEPFLKNKRNRALSKGKSIFLCIVYICMAIVFFVMEVTGNKVDGYTIVRGFVVIGACDIVLEHLGLLLKKTDKEDEVHDV